MRSLALAMFLAVTGCASHPAVRPTPTETATRPGYAALAARVLPSVVLLVRQEPNGPAHFGAGFLVEHGGNTQVHLLTADHVVSGPGTVRALFYDAQRTSYTPMDGGLDRLLFENQAALRPVVVIEHDPVGDLALVAVEPDPRAPLSHLPRLHFSPRDPRIGDEVLALGHPQETVWSFTRGVVSGLHRDMIQHDALSSGGSSGGPLIALDGTVIGVNTAKIVSAARGLGFARPIARAQTLLNGRSEGMDRSTPELAVRACWHAQEVGSIDLAECFDWADAWLDVKRAVDRIATQLPEDGRRLRADLAARGGYQGFLERNHGHLLAEYHRGATIDPTGEAQLTGARRELRQHLSGSRTADENHAAQVARDRNGIHVELRDSTRLREMMRKGLRVSEVRLFGTDAAWILLGSRNPDGSPVSFSEYWVRRSDGWRQRVTAHADERRALPVGWPPPLDDEHLTEYSLIDQLLERAEVLAHDSAGGIGGPRVAPR
jgi:S1-C subfamily serine protease